MLALKDLMTPAPVTIAPGATLRDAVELLTKVGVNALPVTDGDAIVGVITTLSIIAFQSTTPGVPTERDSSDVWESDPTDDEDIPAAEYFAELWEDAGTELDERFRVTDSPEWDFLSDHRVEDAMLSEPVEFSPEANLDEAAERMRTTGAHAVLVVEHGKLCGIVTTMDITRAFAQQRLTEIE
jgi:CBS domain-containing protein